MIFNLINTLDESFEYVLQAIENYSVFLVIPFMIIVLYFYLPPLFSIFTFQGSSTKNNKNEEMVQQLVSRANQHSSKSIKNQHKDIIVAYKESVTALSLLNCAMVLIEESGDSELQIKSSPIHQYYKNLTNFKNDIEVRIDTILIAG